MSDAFKDICTSPEGLIMPRVVAALPEDVFEANSNGCGPKSMKVKLIPDKLFGVNFYKPCSVHDNCYTLGTSTEDKNISDRCFAWNLLKEVDDHCQKHGIIEEVEYLAYREAAEAYYHAVADWGNRAFDDEPGKGPRDVT